MNKLSDTLFYAGTLDLGSMEDFLAFLTGRSKKKVAADCKRSTWNEVKTTLEYDELYRVSNAYTKTLFSAIAGEITSRYPTITANWYVNYENTSFDLSYEGETATIENTDDYIEFLDSINGEEGLLDIIEEVYNYDIDSTTESEANWLKTSDTVAHILNHNARIDEFIPDDEKTEQLLDDINSNYILDNAPKGALGAAIVVKQLIDELTDNTTAKVSCDEKGMAILVEATLNERTYNIKDFDDMSTFMTDYTKSVG